jgi:formylglycine-generating enzyme required for sulfatase activity
MGTQEAPDMNDVAMQATTHFRPIHHVYLDDFWMDKTDVSNEEFAKFVKATGYVTVAERTPLAEDFPGGQAVDARPRAGCRWSVHPVVQRIPAEPEERQHEPGPDDGATPGRRIRSRQVMPR